MDAGETVELCGTHVFDAVHVAEGGVLKVTPYDGTEPTGRLDLRADTIHIGEGGIVDADGSGYRGVPGANGEGEGGGLAGGDDLVIYSGGSGGGYGESGEAGRGLHETTRGGRVVHGSQPWKVDRGSAGGGYVTYDVKEVAPENYHAGGHGGGAVILRAESLILDGLITANGQDASSRNAHGYYGATGGGAGGGVLLIARSITGQGTVSAKGGKAVSNFYRHGGVGGGGRIVMLYSKLLDFGVQQFGGTSSVFTRVYGDPLLRSTTHPESSLAYADANPHFVWNAQDDFEILGYRYALVADPSQMTPEMMKNADFTVDSSVSLANLDDGVYHLFVVHVFPDSSTTFPIDSFQITIDTHADPPGNLRSPTHPDSQVAYAEREGFLEWDDPHELAGVEAYLVAVTRTLAPPPESAYSRVTGARYVFQYLDDGTHYIQVRTLDRLGHKSEAAIFRVTVGGEDPPTPTPTATPIPAMEVAIRSSSHPNPGVLYRDDFAQFSWEDVSDAEVLGYQYILVRQSSLVSEAQLRSGGTFTTSRFVVFANLSDGTYSLFVVQVLPDASFSPVRAPFSIHIDSSVPEPPNLRSPTHPNQSEFYFRGGGYLIWDEPNDPAGIAGYFVAITQEPEELGESIPYLFTTETQYVFTNLTPGIHYFVIKAQDKLGNESEPLFFQLNVAVTITLPTPQPLPTATPVPPLADAGQDVRLPYLGASALLQGGGSTGLGLRIEEYSWREDPDNPVRGLLPNYVEEPTVEVSPPMPGLYRFSLVIRTERQNSAPDSVLVYVPGIAGRVTVIGTSVPVSGAHITDGTHTSGGLHTATSDSTGDYVLYGSREGESFLEASHPNFSIFHQTLIVNAAGLNFDFAMTGTYHEFSGQVVTGSGTPVDQVTVMVEPYTNLATSTDTAGQFYFGDVPFGSRLVNFTKPGYASVTMPVYFGRDVTDLTVRIQSGGASSLQGLVRSSVTGLPLSGVQIKCGDRAAVSDDEGHYALPALYSGSNLLSAEGRSVVPLFKALEIPEGGLVHNIALNEQPVSVGGLLVRSGEALAGARIRVEGAEYLETNTDGTGYFLLPRISLGQRTLLVTPQDGETRRYELDIVRSVDVQIDYDSSEDGEATTVRDWLVR